MPFYYSNDIFSFTLLDKSTFSLKKMKFNLPARAGHQMIVCEGKLYFIGGNFGNEYLSDCYCLNSKESDQLLRIADLNLPRSRANVTAFK
jgi:hypothetical protein